MYQEYQDDSIAKTVLNLPTVRRGSGRPRTSWLTTIQKDSARLNLENEKQNRNVWKNLTRRADHK